MIYIYIYFLCTYFTYILVIYFLLVYLLISIWCDTQIYNHHHARRMMRPKLMLKPSLLDNLVRMYTFYTNDLRYESEREYEKKQNIIQRQYALFKKRREKYRHVVQQLKTGCSSIALQNEKELLFKHLESLSRGIQKSQKLISAFNRYTYQTFAYRNYLDDPWFPESLSKLADRRSALSRDLSDDNNAGAELQKRVSCFNHDVSELERVFIYKYPVFSGGSTRRSRDKAEIDKKKNSERKNVDVEKYECDCEEPSDRQVVSGTDNRPVCASCGVVLSIFSEHTISSLDDIYALYPRADEVRLVRPKVRYKRLNHFKETLKQLQGLTAYNVPFEIISRVRAFAMNKSIAFKNLVPGFIRDILQQIKLSMYYEHCVSICAAINKDFKPIRASASTRMKMLLMFLELENVFPQALKNLQSTRKNFISYHFTLCRISQLIGLHGMCRSTRLLKSGKLFQEQDKIWKEMCRLLHWPYVEPTDSS